MLTLLLSQVPDSVGNAFLSQGITGVVALLAIGVAYALYKEQKSAHARERLRADASEKELKELYKTIQEKYMSALNDATRAVADALAKMREH
jgi:alkylhydroperoxidase/carboxymuconolactone decarboxylase family protein YurZ